MTAGFGANSRAGTYYKKQEPRPRKARLLLAQPAMAEVIAQHCVVMITGNFKGFKGITPEIYLNADGTMLYEGAYTYADLAAAVKPAA